MWCLETMNLLSEEKLISKSNFSTSKMIVNVLKKIEEDNGKKLKKVFILKKKIEN